jgi:hypothetical protein
VSDDKVKEVAAEMRAQATRGQGPLGYLPQFAGPGQLNVWADRLDPPPEPEKPARYWLHLAGTYSGYGGEIECRRQQSKPGIEWVEFHSADAPHCDKPEHADPPGWRCVPPEPHCDVDGHKALKHEFLKERLNLLAAGELCRERFDEIVALKSRVSELEALLREVGRKMHNMNAPGDSSFPFEECGGDPCSRVRAALGGK